VGLDDQSPSLGIHFDQRHFLLLQEIYPALGEGTMLHSFIQTLFSIWN
jgi:hypothetical protein